MHFSKRQWLIYVLAWIPYAFSYIAVFLAQGVDSIWLAFTTMLCNIPGAMCLGIVLIVFLERLTWKKHQRWYFYPVHFISALIFAFGWYALVVLFLSIYSSLLRGVWSPNWFTGYALQWQIFSGLMIYSTITCIIYLLQTSENLLFERERARLAETRAAQIESLLAQSQLSVLRAQLNPHFLFNTLHSLMALIRYEPHKAEAALEKLSEMLRYVLQEKKASPTNLIRFAEEWNFIENYLELEQMRLGERLTIKSSFSAGVSDCLIPAFTLQPIIENAVKHGISPFKRTGIILIKAEKTKENLLIEISDDAPEKSRAEIIESNGLGLKLVGQQLAVHYRGKAEFTIANERKRGFSVSLKIPLMITNEQDPHFNN